MSYKRSKLRHEDIMAIMEDLDLGFSAYGGNCFSVAYALKHALIKTGILAVSINDNIYQKSNRFIGHCAVHFNGLFYDGVRAMSEDEFRETGELVPDNPEFAELAGMTLFDWSEGAYNDSSIFLIDDEIELQDYFIQDVIESVTDKIKMLTSQRLDK